MIGQTPEALGAPTMPTGLLNSAPSSLLTGAPSRLGQVLPLGVALAAGLVIGAIVGPALLSPKPAPEVAMAPGWIEAVASKGPG